MAAPKSGGGGEWHEEGGRDWGKRRAWEPELGEATAGLPSTRNAWESFDRKDGVWLGSVFLCALRRRAGPPPSGKTRRRASSQGRCATEAYKATDTVQGTHTTYTQSMDGRPRPTRQRQKQQTLFIRTHHCSSEPAKHLNDLPHHHAYRFKEYSRVFINILT
jgi:hypothetical protein